MHKIVFKLLAIQLSFLFFCVVLYSTPHKTNASGSIGTHLGEGDVGYQINIIKNVLIPNGLEPGSPITVMVPVTMLQDSQSGTVQELANAVSSGGFFPIVRINGVCENFTAETGKDAAASVDTARGIFGSDALIVWGNEINNKEKECSNWEKYLQDYIQIEGRPNVSPAALDYYMGNPAFTVAKMFADTPGMEAIFSAAPRASNSYGCVGSNKIDCDPLSTTTQQVGYQDINGTFYLTEFSLSPEGNSADAPDTDIVKVLEFIANRAAETGAKVTPLVRNVCNSESDWLLYVNGKLFTPQGNEVSENCDGISGGSGYDLSLYPEYDVDESKFYLSPIRSLIRGGTPDRTVENLRKELALQGYEAYCAAEGVVIEPEYNTRELIDTYVRLYPNDVKILEVDAIEAMSSTTMKYPLWRDVSNKQFLLASLEEYFGFRDVYETSPSDTVLTSSPINSLLTEPQLCVQGWKNLVAQQLACERLEKPEECELLARPIPGTSRNVSQALALLSRYSPYYRDGTENVGCSMLMAGTRPELGLPMSQAEIKELKETLMNVPTYFDRAYRYGFLIASIHTKDPGTANGNVATKIFNFFTNTTRSAKPEDEVLVVAFKIPDIATNKGGGDDAGSQFWSDPLDLTRKLLTTKKAQVKHEDVDRDVERKLALLRAEDAEEQDENSKIYCHDEPSGRITPSCRNELTRALADIVNGNALGCGEAEKVSVITDIAGLDDPLDPYGKVFNADNGGQVLLNLFLKDVTHPAAGIAGTDPQRAETKEPQTQQLESLFTISKETWPGEVDATTVDFYLVYPMGFELKAVEEAMKGAFFTKAQISALDTTHIIDGFELTGQSIGLAASTDGFEFEDYEKTAAQDCGTEDIINPTTGLPTGGTRPKVCMEEVTVSVKQGDASMGILGARLGFWMRQIQKQLNTRSSQAWQYFDSCKTTEEFMLGKCTGGSLTGKPGNVGDGSTPTPTDALVSVAQCNGGPRITSGETATHIDVVGTGACSGKETKLFVSASVNPSQVDPNNPYDHNIENWKNPNDPVISCDDLYSYADCTYPQSLVQNPVNSEGKFVENGNVTACQYVVDTAKELGVSPRLALAMWGEESGFSHYRVADLGVISQPSQDLGAQVTVFANTLKSHSTYLSFLEAYSGEERGANDPSPYQFCNNAHFVGRLRTYYDFLGPR